MTLHQLLRSRMDERGWSYSDLERRSDRALSRGRWQQLGSGVQQKKFPDPASLVVIAQVLEIDITTVVLAAAGGLGLDTRIHGSEFARLLPAGTERLSAPMRDAILGIIRAAVADADAHPESAGSAPNGLRLEWSKAAAPSRQNPNGPNADASPDAL
ncbi:MAG: helix-turn-helix transcriptional regulator [Pseudonocardia sp.]|nr:helix-turn-helix transcriptional regulator [Pseudonocardia sp.]